MSFWTSKSGQKPLSWNIVGTYWLLAYLESGQKKVDPGKYLVLYRIMHGWRCMWMKQIVFFICETIIKFTFF